MGATRYERDLRLAGFGEPRADEAADRSGAEYADFRHGPRYGDRRDRETSGIIRHSCWVLPFPSTRRAPKPF
jgi:hypothetical protein